MKRFIKVLLLVSSITIIMIIGTSAVSAAEIVNQGTCGDNLTWTFDDEGTLTISGSGEMTSYNSHSPWYNLEVTTAQIDEGVTSIGKNAFNECCWLENISMPTSLTKIGTSAFQYCTNLKSVTIPDNVTIINSEAFAVSGIESIYFPRNLNSLGSGVCWGCSGLNDVILSDNCSTIPTKMFYECMQLTTLDIPNCVTQIGAEAFEETGLTELTIPDNVTTIGDNAFSLSAINNISLPDSLQNLGNGAFFQCENLSTITLPSNLVEIPESLFWRCYNLKTITIPSSVERIGQLAFSESGLETINWSTGPEYIDYGAFAATKLTKVEIPEGTRILGGDAFNCPRLKEISFPASLEGHEPATSEHSYGGWVSGSPINKIIFRGNSCFNLSHFSMALGDNLAGGGITVGASCCASESFLQGLREKVELFDNNTFVIAHELTHHEGKPPTCTEAGWDEYDTCSICGYNSYKAKPALGHDIVHYKAKTATCTEIGWTEHDVCSRGDYATEYEEFPALNHNIIHHGAKAPSCTEVGWDEYDTCSRCDYTTYVVIPARGHDLVQHAAKAPTCTSEGCEAYDTCSRCDYTTYQAIPAKGHKWGSWNIIRNPSCTDEGIRVRFCDYCDAENRGTIKKNNHTWTHVKNAAALLKNGSEYDQCTVCKTKKNAKTLPGYANSYVKGLKVSKAKKAFTVKWKKQNKKKQKLFNGYQIRYSTKANMSGAKTATAKKSSKSKKIKKLQKKTMYYVQVRTFTKTSAGTFYSKWSATKSVKTK